jgi:hypothetical protein
VNNDQHCAFVLQGAARRRVQKEDKMANEQTSFDDLVSQAPAATVSVVGTLAKSSEEGKFVLVLQNGGTVTLETAAVRGHTVLGTSLGQTIVRVDVDAEKLPGPAPLPSVTPFTLAAPQQVSPAIFTALQSLRAPLFKAPDVPHVIGTGSWDPVIGATGLKDALSDPGGSPTGIESTW